MKLQLNEETLNAYINEAIKEELNERGLIVTPMTDKINAFLYEKIYEIAQAAEVGPQVDSPEEFYEEIGKDRETLKKIADVVTPIISEETGIPAIILRPLIILALKDAAKDANKTFDRVAKRREEKEKKKMSPQLAEETLNTYINEAIKEELNEGRLAYRVNFGKMGQPENPGASGMWDRIKEKAITKGLESGKYGSNGSRRNWTCTFLGPIGKYINGPHNNQMREKLISDLHNLGYSDKQISDALKNGAIEVGKYNQRTKAFSPNTNKKQKRNLNRVAKKSESIKGYYDDETAASDSPDTVAPQQNGGVTPNSPDTTAQEPSAPSFPWDNITPEEINGAKEAQRKAREAWQQKQREKQEAEAARQRQAELQQQQQAELEQQRQAELQKQQQRSQMQKIEPLDTSRLNMPTGVTSNQRVNTIRRPQPTVADRAQQLMASHASAYAKGNETYGQARRGVRNASRSANGVSDYDKAKVNTTKQTANNALKDIRANQYNS